MPAWHEHQRVLTALINLAPKGLTKRLKSPQKPRQFARFISKTTNFATIISIFSYIMILLMGLNALFLLAATAFARAVYLAFVLQYQNFLKNAQKNLQFAGFCFDLAVIVFCFLVYRWLFSVFA